MPDELVQYQDEIGQRSDHTDHLRILAKSVTRGLSSDRGTAER